MRAAAYARYSTNRQTENSIAYQLTEIHRYCKERNITIISEYVDEARTGTNTDRPGLQMMLAAAERGEFEAVVLYDISRGSRDVADWFGLRKKLMMLGIEVISVTQQLGDALDPNGFLLELIGAGLGQHAVLQTREKSIAGVAVKAKEAAFLGGQAPLGYDIVDGKYVMNEPEARIVRLIFSMHAAGESYNAILDALGGARGKNGRPIGKNSLYSILSNERYIGVYTWNKRRVKTLGRWAGGTPNPDCVRIENAIPRIIDQETWEKVQRRMSDRKRNASNKAKRKYLLSGLIECDQCGAAYVGHTSTSKRGYETRYYVCGNKYRTHTCNAKNINANEIEAFVVQYLKKYFLEMDFEETAQRVADTINGASADLSAEKAELRDIESQITNGMRAILGGMHFPELEEELDRLRVRKSELQDIIGRRSASSREVDPADLVALFEEAAENFGDDAKLPEIIRQHVTKIYAHADGSVSVNIGVHILGCGGAQLVICTDTFHKSA